MVNWEDGGGRLGVSYFSTIFSIKTVLNSGSQRICESENIPDPGALGGEIDSDLEAAFEQFRDITTDLSHEQVESEKSD